MKIVRIIFLLAFTFLINFFIVEVEAMNNLEEPIILDKKIIEGEKSFQKVSGLEVSEDHILKVVSDYKNLDSKEKYGAYLNEEEIKAVEKILEIDQVKSIFYKMFRVKVIFLTFKYRDSLTVG